MRRRNRDAHLGIDARDFIQQFRELNRSLALTLRVVSTREPIGVPDKGGTVGARQTLWRRPAKFANRIDVFPRNPLKNPSSSRSPVNQRTS